MSAARSTVLVLLGLMALVAVLLTPPPAAVLAQSPSTDATLGGLTLSEGRLDPVFATGTTDYAAGVGYTVTRITLVPTTTDANATVAYLDGSDSPLPDANMVTDEQDVDLVVGETVVQVKITAEDTSTVLTYTVTITRTEEDTSLRPTASDPVAANPSSAVYGVTFQGTWTRSVTPGGVPGSAHFTRLVGGVHGDAVTFLESGGTASAGVEYMAENGGASDFNSEVQAAIEATPRTALSVIEGGAYVIGPQVSKTLDNVELTTDFPRVTLTTMVAPSPDWFVGVSGLPLLDDQGRWLRSHEVNLYPWDAGTEDGGEFSLSNAATSPQGVITSIRGTGKFSTEPIASLSFTLESVRTTRSVAENTGPGVSIGAPVTVGDSSGPDSSGPVTYILGGRDAASFDIVEATGQLQTKAALDYERKSSYEVTVTATDPTGSVDIMVAIEVTNIVELQPLTGPATVDYEESRAVRVAAYSASSEADLELLTWSLSGPDAGSFRIDEPGGVLRFDLPVVSPNLFSPLPDYEAPTDTGRDGAYEVTVEVSDGVSSDSLDVAVTITDQEEAGEVSLSPVRPRVGMALDATLTDPDGSISGVAWTWERSTGPTTWVAIGGAESSSYTPAAAEAGHYLRATATYTDGHGAGKSARAVAPYTPLAHLLSALSVTGPARGLYPAFDPEVLHYAMECAADQTITLTLSAAESSTRVAVNGFQRSSQNAVVELTGLDGYSDIPITLSGSEGGATTYVLHCFQEDFPDITTEKGSGATEELIGFSFRTNRPGGDTDAYMMIVDNNGVPRVHRRFGHRVTHFRPQNSETYPFSYPVPDAQTANAWILADRDLNDLERVTTVSPLGKTDDHDFIILDNGDYLLLSYEPVLRDFSSLTGGDGNPLPPNPDRPDGRYPVKDTAIQIRTAAGAQELTWYSWHHMAVQDCGRGEPFPGGDWAHGNSLWMADGVILASFRSCGKVLGIDAATGDVVWRLGRSYRSTEEWGRDDLSGEGRGTGPAPMTIRNDPYGGFCGQHSAQLLDNGHLLLYDNGGPCVVDLATGLTQRESGVFSRAVEYAIDPDNGEAIFQRHHSLHGDFNRFGGAAGLVEPMGNGDWLISWGWDLLDDDPNAALPPDESVTQVDPDDGTETFSINVQFDHRGEESIAVRAYPLSPVTLAAEPIALTAEFPASTYTSIFHLGATDEPQVVVSFSRPIVDFDETSPSLSVSGAEVASVSAHVVAGEPAHAYLVTLTPDGDGAITFDLLADQACAGGGICTADGTTLAPLTTNVIELQPITGPATVGYEENRAVRVATFSASSEADRELLTWSLSGPDAGSFRIDEPAGVLRFDLPVVSPNLFSPQPDYEAPTDTGTDGAYEVTVEVGDGVTTHSLDVAVTITDQDEAGTLTLSPTRPRQAELVTATLSDPDTVTGTPDWTWERSAGRSAWHVINGATAASYTPTAADAGHYLRVSTSYTDGHGSGKTAQTVAPNVVLARTLSRLEVVTTSSRQMYPAFDREIIHYAVGCIAADTLRLTLSTTDAATRLAVDGVQYANQNAVVELTGKGGESDILITLSGGSDGASTTYTIHCLAEDFPTISVTKGDGASESLMTASFEVSSGVAHIAIIDHNGVPRFRRQQTAARHFRAYPDGGYPYALAVTREPASYVVYDANLDVVQSGISTVNLQNTDGHDFFIASNGDYVLIAYEPSVRDLSFITEQYGLTHSNGDPFGPAEDTEDSVIQVVTPAGQEVFLWSSWDHMAIEDCTQHRFPDDYSHINSLQVVDGDIVASFRGCSKVLRIDGTSGEVIWRLGRSNLSTEEWERRNIGPPPLKIVGDPYGEFCGQHAARLLDNGHLILFDNGVQCVEDPRTGETERVGEQFSRVVEYAIDLEQGEAIFQRHVFLHGSMNRLSYAMGQNDALDNGNWLITWGRGARAPNPGDPPAPDVSATQVNPATGVEELTVVARIDGDVQTQGRMYPVAPVALAAEPIALTAEFPASTYTSIFHLGATDEPQVVVSFSRPIVDFDETTPSLSVQGASVASVSPHVVAGEPAHAYLVTLTPDGYGPITFRLLSYQACADGGICTADGTTLSEAPAAPVTIPTFVAEVSIEPGPSPVTEGGDVTFTLTRDGPLTAELTVNVSVAETGSMLSGALPVSATFEVGADTTSLTLTTEDDAPIEDPSSVTVTIEADADADARYQAAPGAAAADVVVLDDVPRFLLRVGPAEVTEGGGGAVTVEVTNSVSLATAQTISLTLSGTATADDFTLLSTSDRTLSAPYALTIPANERVAAAYISTVNDALPEPAETLTITASHDGTDIGTGTMTLRASPLRLELSSLTASGGGGRAMYPSFDPGTLHYAVGCDPAQPLTLRLSTTDATTRLAVNGVQQVSQNAVVELNQLDGDDDILIALSNAAGASTTYVVHCMNSNDPLISVVKRPGSAIELIAASVTSFGAWGLTGHLLVLDTNAVPRFHHRIDDASVTHFRPQNNQEFPYSYAQALPDLLQTHWGGRGNFEIVILDQDFNEVRRVTTTSAIPQTNQHDFLTKADGNFVLTAYATFAHDISEFVDPFPIPNPTNQLAEDSLIEEVKTEGERGFYWSTYGHVYLGDCMEHQFPANYAHLNSLQLVDGEDLVISLRNCSQILRIDGTSGEVQWRLGSSYLSDAEWEQRELGPPPLRIIGDPYVEFCGQHSAKLLSNGHLLLFDNGWHCRRDKSTDRPTRPEEEFSRVVEYALDLDQGTATFVRHHSLRHSFAFFNEIQGHVVPMVNDSWLIDWGGWIGVSNKPSDTSVTEYNPTTDQELLSLTLRNEVPERMLASRPYPLGFDVLEQQAEPLAAALPQSAHTSVFTFGQSDTPTVVVAFSEPVVDFATDTPSVSVGGATIASVAAHVAAGEPANAYLFTLTPDGDGAITLGLFANQSCASGGICTADGARLSEVPGTYTIEAPVRVSFEQTSFTAPEGASASIVVILSAPSGPFGITIPIVVTGGTASADEYSAPESVVFSSGSDRQTISIPLGDDALIEGDETIALAFGDLPTGVTPGTNATTTVTITDADSAAFEFAISDDEVGEGATVDLTVTLDGVATFATAQTIDLTFPGGAATAGVDFTVADARGQALTAPYALTLPAGASSVAATISIVDDAAEEGNETIRVSARHGAASLGDRVITILANDAPPPPTNSPPVFTEGRSAARSLAENTGPNINIGRPLAATDIDQGDTLTYSLGGTDVDFFTVVRTSGQLLTRSGVTYDHEAKDPYEVTVSVSDGEATASIDVTIAVTDVDEPPDAPVVQVDTASPVSLNVTWLAPATSGRPAVSDYDLRYKLTGESTFIDGPQDVSGTSATIGELIPASSYGVQVRATNAEGDGAWSASQPGVTAVLPVVALILSESSIPENRGMSTVTATVSPASPTPFSVEIWAAAFPPIPGQFETSLNNILSFAANETESTGEVVITGLVATVVNVTGTLSPAGVLVKPPARVQLRITAGDTDPDPQPGPIITGGGGGGGSGPTPSDVDFEWNVERDIEALDSGHDTPSGLWSDGATIWVLENGDGADDAVYAYDLVTGERVEDREFELDETNRAPRGLWSNSKTAWVSDSGQNHLFAYDLESGERVEEREVELDTRNRDPRGIWSDGTTVWVLDGGKSALFGYDLKSGELLAEYALDSGNDDPRGLWSDGVTLWVSDHVAKRLFAYRLPARPEAPAAEDAERQHLERVIDEEFKDLPKASNNSPRGIWSDGGVMYVADQSDGRVYSYNMPHAIDARLASLTLGGVDFGEFLPRLTEYEGVADEGVTETTVEAVAVQSGAEVAIEPADADEATDGHQLALGGVEAITVTVTSADESRTKDYLVRFGDAGPSATCLRGAITVGFSLLVSEGGSVEDLAACAQSRHVTALYALHEGVYVSYILGAPDFVNRAFVELFTDGVPPVTPLVAGSEGPATADPGAGTAGDGEPWPLCLRGAITEGFSLVLYGVGSVEALDTCAQSQLVTALYALDDGEWVSYILGAPEFVNREFRELFADGLRAITPLIARGTGPPSAGSAGDDAGSN